MVFNVSPFDWPNFSEGPEPALEKPWCLYCRLVNMDGDDSSTNTGMPTIVRVPTSAEVVEYFRRLPKHKIRGNKAMKEALRALARSRTRNGAGPGRPRTVAHDPDKGPYCPCVDCRRKYPSYQHRENRLAATAK